MLNYDEYGKPLIRESAAGDAPPRLIEYGAPGEDCTNEPTAPQSLVTFPSRYFHAVIMMMTAVGLVCWAGARSATWRQSSGFTRRMAALVSGSGHEPGRKYLLAGLASLLVMELFAAQFPDIGGVILKWIDPVRKVLPSRLWTASAPLTPARRLQAVM